MYSLRLFWPPDCSYSPPRSVSFAMAFKLQSFFAPMTDDDPELGDPTSNNARFVDTLLENLDGMVYRCQDDAQWTMEFVSDGCFALTGYLPEDIVGNKRISYEEITHPEDRAHVRAVIGSGLARTRRFEVEYRIVKATGEIRWVWERGVGFFGSSDKPEALEGFIQDITERKNAEHALQEAERRYRSIFENAIEGIFQSTPESGYVAVNPALARLYGYDSPEHLITELRDIDSQLYVDKNRRADFLRALMEHGSITNFESRIYRRDGEIIWISENARVVYDEAGKFMFFEGTVEAITERKLHEAEIQHRATHDVLTGLPNRALLHERLQAAIQDVHRSDGLAAVVFVDLDQFKLINDTLGHQVGDHLLRTVAERLSACVGESDTVGRQGGDEFVVLLTRLEDATSLTATLQHILQTLGMPWSAGGRELHTTCSIGVSLCPLDGVDADTLLKNADSAMYRAKQQGRNNFRYFSSEMNAHLEDRLEMLVDLRHAQERNEFVLHYQPKINLRTGKIVGAEALIRWNSPTRGLVKPISFIALLEESGLIIPIGEWVLRTACAHNKGWQAAGLAAIPVSVNLSPRQLGHDDVTSTVARALADHGLDAAYLELEITENVVMLDTDRSAAALEALRAMGIQIALDDFGTGYSSLSYLKRFPVNVLKIDQSFVHDIASDPDDAAIVKAILSLGHILNLRVVAEGVETDEQYRFLLENHCDEVQGHFFGEPIPADEFARLLEESFV